MMVKNGKPDGYTSVRTILLVVLCVQRTYIPNFICVPTGPLLLGFVNWRNTFLAHKMGLPLAERASAKTRVWRGGAQWAGRWVGKGFQEHPRPIFSSQLSLAGVGEILKAFEQDSHTRPGNDDGQPWGNIEWMTDQNHPAESCQSVPAQGRHHVRCSQVLRSNTGVLMTFLLCQDTDCCFQPPPASTEPTVTVTFSWFLESQDSRKSGKAAVKYIWSVEMTTFFFPSGLLLVESHSCFLNQRSIRWIIFTGGIRIIASVKHLFHN